MIDVAGGNVIYYYHFDGLGSVVALSNNSGQIVEQYSYDVFGAPNRVSGVNNPYMFTGRRFDPETALYYYRARYYAPDIGRFLQTDPVGYAAGLNLYTYVGNNPLNWIDPFGLCKDGPQLGDTYEECVEIAALPWRLTPWALEYNKWVQKKYPQWPTLNPAEIGYGMALEKITKNYSNQLIKIFGKDISFWRGWVRVQKWEYQSDRYGFLWLKKRIIPVRVGKADWREVIGNNWWSKEGWFTRPFGYHTEQQAFEAAFRESYWRYK